MFKLFKKENKIDIILDGELEIKEPSLLDYEQYKKKKIKEQLIISIVNKLFEISPATGHTYDNPRRHYEIIATYLADKELG